MANCYQGRLKVTLAKASLQNNLPCLKAEGSTSSLSFNVQCCDKTSSCIHTNKLPPAGQKNSSFFIHEGIHRNLMTGVWAKLCTNTYNIHTMMPRLERDQVPLFLAAFGGNDIAHAQRFRSRFRVAERSGQPSRHNAHTALLLVCSKPTFFSPVLLPPCSPSTLTAAHS